MARRSSRIILWCLVAIVIALAVATVYSIAELDEARSARCRDVVEERQGDRLLWHTILDRVSEENGGNDLINEYRTLIDQIKPPLNCNKHNIPTVVSLPSRPSVANSAP